MSAQATMLRHDATALALALLLLLAWDASGLDLWLLRAVGDASGFVWRDHWLMRGVLHDGGRALGWVACTALAINLRRPLRFARGLSRRERLWWIATTLACAALIPLLKRWSLTSCPWSLAEFGGGARYVSHWSIGVPDGGPGGCFPSGHASSAFAFLSGWFALRGRHARVARRWLAATLLAGALMGAAQMMRGAHPVSHTLWTGWICFALSVLAWHGSARWRADARMTDERALRGARMTDDRALSAHDG